MGTEFRIVLYAQNQKTAETAADSAFQRVEALNHLLSDYINDSELNRLSATSGTEEEVSVSTPLFINLAKALKVAEKTNGAFDVTLGPYIQIWREIRNEPNPQLPDASRLKEASEAVGYDAIVLNEKELTVKLTRPGMQLDLGGIAKGHAADEALAVLRYFGINSALIDAGGDIVMGEAPPGREGWDIQIYSEYHQRPFILTLSNRAITTSGDLFQYIEINGIRYSHIINPKTGLGLTARRRATVIGNTGIGVDAFATALNVLTPSESLEIIEACDHLEAYIEVNEADSIITFETAGFKELRNRKSVNK